MTRPDPEELVPIEPTDAESRELLKRIQEIVGDDVHVSFALHKTRTKNTKGNGEA